MLLEKDQKVSQNSSRLSDSRSYASIRIQKDKNYKVFFFFDNVSCTYGYEV